MPIFGVTCLIILWSVLKILFIHKKSFLFALVKKMGDTCKLLEGISQITRHFIFTVIEYAEVESYMIH